MLVVGDVHGYYKTLRALLDKCPKDEVCLVGDLIDRGPSSKEVVNFCMGEGLKVTLGNHEDMMLVYFSAHNRIYNHNIWLPNGGTTCVESYLGNTKPAPKEVFDIFAPTIDYFLSLPLFLDFPQVQDDTGRGLFVSHTSISKDLESSLNMETWDKLNDSILWSRGIPSKLENRFHIFGHTPVPQADIKSYYANVDTGCFIRSKGHGRYHHLTALRYPQMEVYTQEVID